MLWVSLAWMTKCRISTFKLKKKSLIDITKYIGFLPVLKI